MFLFSSFIQMAILCVHKFKQFFSLYFLTFIFHSTTRDELSIIAVFMLYTSDELFPPEKCVFIFLIENNFLYFCLNPLTIPHSIQYTIFEWRNFVSESTNDFLIFQNVYIPGALMDWNPWTTLWNDFYSEQQPRKAMQFFRLCQHTNLPLFEYKLIFDTDLRFWCLYFRRFSK